MAKKKEQHPEPIELSNEYKKFEDAVRTVLSVPKQEYDKKIAEEQQSKPKRKRRPKG